MRFENLFNGLARGQLLWDRLTSNAGAGDDRFAYHHLGVGNDPLSEHRYTLFACVSAQPVVVLVVAHIYMLLRHWQSDKLY